MLLKGVLQETADLFPDDDLIDVTPTQLPQLPPEDH